MADTLTPKDKKFLDKLHASKGSVFDRVIVSQLLDIINRQGKALDSAKFQYSAVVLAATGLISEEQILAKGMSADLCDQAVTLRRQYEEARNWREMSATENEGQPFNQPEHYQPQNPEALTQTMIDILDNPARAN